MLAGLIGAVVVLPQGVAYATVAGMPPEYGLYAAMVPAVIAALFGSSSWLVSGPTTAASLLIFSALSVHAVPGSAEYIGLALTLTFMVGVLELAMGVARLGGLVRFISYSVIVGLTAGAAILIATTQLGNFFGVEVPRGGHVNTAMYHFIRQIPNINGFAAVVALSTVASGVLVKRVFPKLHLMAAMVAGGLVAAGLNLVFGPETTGIAVVGALSPSLPPVVPPRLSLDTMRILGPATLAVTMFALMEASAIGRALAIRSDERVDPNQEFIGQGLSNIFGSFFSAYVATGSFNRSAINHEAGAKTPLAAALSGVFLVGVAVVVAPLARYLPDSAMAGILMLVSWSLIDRGAILRILTTDRRESVVMLVTLAAALFLDLEFAIFTGVITSLALYLERTAHPTITRRAPDPDSPRRKFFADPQLQECPQAAFIRIDGSLFFGSVDYVQDYLEEMRHAKPTQKHLILMGQGINSVDLPGADILVREARIRRKAGGDLHLVRCKRGMRDALERLGGMAAIGADHLFAGKSEAISMVVSKLDPDVCAGCSARIFVECAGLPGAATSDSEGVSRARRSNDDGGNGSKEE